MINTNDRGRRRNKLRHEKVKKGEAEINTSLEPTHYNLAELVKMINSDFHKII